MMAAPEALFQYPLFAVLGPRVLEAWAAGAETFQVQRGQTLLQAGEQGEHLYVVFSGQVRVLRHGTDNRDVPLGVFGAGEVFGEYALLPPYLNTATCRASESGTLMRLPLAPVRQLLDNLPGIRGHLKNWLRLHALVAYLRQKAFLGFLSAPSVLPMLDRCQERRFEPGQTIQTQGLSD